MESAGGLGDRWRGNVREESPDTQWKAARPES